MRCEKCGSGYIEIKRLNKLRAFALCKVCLFTWIINLLKRGGL
jgi:hypothetical protein